MTLDPTQFSNILLIVTAWSGAFLIALWLSLVIWTLRDIQARARDPLARILAVLTVAILSIPGLVVYLIIRPSRTLEEEYQQSLEEEALLQSIEDVPVCPGCGRRIQGDWIICPGCHTKLKKNCHECGKLMELPWNLCPFCGTPVPGMRRDGISLDEALQTLTVGMEQPPVETIKKMDIDVGMDDLVDIDDGHEVESQEETGVTE